MGDELEITGVRIGDHYVLDDQLAEGGTGRVYRAHHVCLENRTFAVKLLRGDLAATAEMRHRFINEATTLRRLDHPNIVSVVDVGQTCGLLYMVMDFAPGISLAELIARGPLPPARALAIARQMCLGLEHMHDHGVIHRDFKPDNIVVAATDHGDVVRIVDFGLAITDDPSAARVTREGIAVGTPSYIAPEQARGLPLDGRADLFSLGMSLYEMLAGVLPFSGPPLEVVMLNATEDPPSIAERSAITVPPALDHIVRRLIARSPEARFASAGDVITALDAPDVLVPAEPATTTVRSVAAAVEPLDVQPADVLPPEPPEPPEPSVRVSLLPVYPLSFVPVPVRRRGPTLALGIALLVAASMVGMAVADHVIGEDPAAAAAPPEPVAPAEPRTPAVTNAASPSPTPVTTAPPATTQLPAPAETPSPTPTQGRAGAASKRAAARAVHTAPPAREPTPAIAPAETAPGTDAPELAPPPAEVVDPFTDPPPAPAPASASDPAATAAAVQP